MNWRWGLNIILGLILSINSSCEKEEYHVFPMVYGHAGTALADERAVYPPNSEHSILYALNALDAAGTEVDVQMTKDSVLVLFHDEFIALDQKNVLTCIPEVNWEDIELHNDGKKHPIIRLSQLVTIMKTNPKKVILDLKHYNYCTEEFVNSETYNWALNNEMAELEEYKKWRFTANSRNIDLLAEIDCGEMQKAFETENIELGIDYVNAYELDLIVIRLSSLTEEGAILLYNANVDYGLLSVKTKKEIKATANFKPRIIISDNIAGTKGYYN
tara:strand:+ start:7479 stop:8297 length:819 start_codon:yes stop_codon:yes gene_type:complete